MKSAIRNVDLLTVSPQIIPIDTPIRGNLAAIKRVLAGKQSKLGLAKWLLPLAVMDWYEPDVRSLEAARSLRRQLLAPVVFYGSSTIRLWKNLQDDLGCPDALNLGFGGSTLEACVYFFERLIVPETPGSLVLYAGDNDLGDGRTAMEVFTFFQQFAHKVKNLLSPDMPFGFISIKPSPARFSLIERITEANRLIKREISRQKNTYFIDLFDAMLLPDKTPRSDLFDSEGLHMNRAGYQLWSKLLLPYRNRMFTPQSCAIQAATVSFSKE